MGVPLHTGIYFIIVIKWLVKKGHNHFICQVAISFCPEIVGWRKLIAAVTAMCLNRIERAIAIDKPA